MTDQRDESIQLCLTELMTYRNYLQQHRQELLTGAWEDYMQAASYTPLKTFSLYLRPHPTQLLG